MANELIRKIYWPYACLWNCMKCFQSALENYEFQHENVSNNLEFCIAACLWNPIWFWHWQSTLENILHTSIKLQMTEKNKRNIFMKPYNPPFGSGKKTSPASTYVCQSNQWKCWILIHIFQPICRNVTCKPHFFCPSSVFKHLYSPEHIEIG